MPLDGSTLITTVGGTTSNSYVSLQELTDYRDLNRLDAAGFDGAEPDDKIRALLMAARKLERENWQGDRASSLQALAWPRSGVLKPDGTGVYSGSENLGAGALTSYRGGYGIYFANYGEQYKSTEIPKPIKDAQCELALAYLDGFGEEDSQITSYSMDGLSVQKQLPTKSLPDTVAELLSGLVQGFRLMRG